VWIRGGIYLNGKLGRASRVFAPRPWEQIHLNDIARHGTPSDPEAYARFKREQAPAFLFPLGRPPEVPESIRNASVERQPPFRERLELLAQDRCVYFFRTPAPTAIDWHANPIDGMRSDPNKTWCDIPGYLPEQGDPRMLWEPSRAAWAIDLARARSHGLEVDAGELFWRWVDSWMQACPPFLGFQWKCGQESSVRLIAIAFAFWSLGDDPATTPERWLQFARLAWATGYRVRHHISYAISQKNNHAISEACGLLLISQLFPEFREAAEWQALGRRVLAREIRRQTYDDGSYVQQSMNYQRVMLHGSLLGLRLAELARQPFDRDVYDRLARCGEFLFQMMNPDTGRLPQYGNNDGANILPLSECDFTDFRPVIQATHYLARRERLLPAGPWDEDLLWLFGPEDPTTEDRPVRRPTSSAFEVGGYYTLRGRESWAMIRCHTYRNRPSHCDQLHLDLWWRGQNLMRDCGTYHYYVPEQRDLEYYFKASAAHNNITIDRRDPRELVSRFVWFPWPRARKRAYQVPGSGPISFEGECYDYDRAPWKVLHRRTLIGLESDTWVVIDDLLGHGEHEAVLRWHMLDAPYDVDAPSSSIRLETPLGDVFLTVTGQPAPPRSFEVLRGHDQPGRVQGWEAPYYGERLPIPTLEISWRNPLPLRVMTTINPGVAVRPKRVCQSSETERWELAVADTVWTMELASPQRSAARMLLGHTRRTRAANSNRKAPA
jgi:asparagine synthase (glutamine-hydrolysing)